jgi:hypothetical protein
MTTIAISRSADDPNIIREERSDGSVWLRLPNHSRLSPTE